MAEQDNKTDSRNSQILIRIMPFVIIAIFLVVWAFSFIFGTLHFNRNNSALIYSSIIAGMSALLSIVLAVSIFRIQSLENRIQSVEQFTLDYIFKITNQTYPYWCISLEEQIRNKSITEKYFKIRESGIITERKEKRPELEKDRDDQQERLNHNLIMHTNLQQAIRRMKQQIQGVAIFLIIPIAFSFLLLISTDSLSDYWNFVLVSGMVYLSVIGVGLLISVVLQSMIQQVDA